MNYKVKEIVRNDCKEVLQLFKNTFLQPMCEKNSELIFLWFYFENFYKKHYTNAIFSKESMLSYWGFIPLDYIEKNRVLKGVLSIQLVGNKNILGSTLILWKKIKNDLIRDKINLCFTINHENSEKIFRSLKWQVTPTPIMVSISHSFLLLNDLINRKLENKRFRRLLNKVLLQIDKIIFSIFIFFNKKSKYIKEVKHFDDDSSELFNKFNESIKIGIRYNKQYLKWRYINKPNNNYKILSYVSDNLVKAYIVYGIKTNQKIEIGYIMDIIADPSDKKIINTLIKYVKKDFYHKKVSFVSALSFNNNVFYKYYKKNNFFKIPQIFLPHKSFFSIYRFQRNKYGFNIEDWHMSWGLHDNI